MANLHSLYLRRIRVPDLTGRLMRQFQLPQATAINVQKSQTARHCNVWHGSIALSWINAGASTVLLEMGRFLIDFRNFSI